MEVCKATWDEVRDFCKKCDLAIVPCGVVETKGYHQPMATDAILSEELAKRIAERVEALVAPTITVGVAAAGARAFPGSLQVSPNVFRDYVREICDWLVFWGFKRFLFISAHGPNGAPLAEVASYLKGEHSARCAYIQFNPFYTAFAEDLVVSETPFGHAGEAEASIMLHWRPDLVKMDKAVNYQPKPTSSVPGLEKFVDYEYDFGYLSETGHWGDPTVATAEKGAEIEKRMLDFLEKFIQEELS